MKKSYYNVFGSRSDIVILNLIFKLLMLRCQASVYRFFFHLNVINCDMLYFLIALIHESSYSPWERQRRTLRIIFTLTHL